MHEHTQPAQRKKISLFIADLDGTLVTPDKELTLRAIAAVDKLFDAGVIFTVTSGRPPRGMRMVIDQLKITAPVSSFNGGVFVRPDQTVIEEYDLDPGVARQVIDLIPQCGLDVWVYQGDEWYIHNTDAPHVAREGWTVKFPPTVVSSFPEPLDHVRKIVGVSDDYDAVTHCVGRVQQALGDTVSAAKSQPYYMDVTHPKANKCYVVETLSRICGVPIEEIATIGDMPSDTAGYLPELPGRKLGARLRGDYHRARRTQFRTADRAGRTPAGVSPKS